MADQIDKTELNRFLQLIPFQGSQGRVNQNAHPVKYEKPIHRLIQHLRMEGKTEKEIAGITGMSEMWVATILGQDWAQANMALMLQQANAEGLEKTIAECAKVAAVVAKYLMDNSLSENIRQKSAFKFLELAVGSKIRIVDSPKDLESLDAEIKRMEAEITAVTKKN